jgi:uncharacterized phage infection (PIP) family protein YhgE
MSTSLDPATDLYEQRLHTLSTLVGTLRADNSTLAAQLSQVAA